MLDYLQFARDMAALGKIIIDVSDGTDSSTERGRQQLEDRILAAQRERERMATRRRKAAESGLSDEGRWGGGPTLGMVIRRAAYATGERQCPEPPEHAKKDGGVSRTPEGSAPSTKWWFSSASQGRGFSDDSRRTERARHPGPARRQVERHHRRQDPHIAAAARARRRDERRDRRQGHAGLQERADCRDPARQGRPAHHAHGRAADRPGDLGSAAGSHQSRLRARGQAQSRHLLYRVLFCRSCSPRPFNPETAIRMYGSRRHAERHEVQGGGRHPAYYWRKSAA